MSEVVSRGMEAEVFLTLLGLQYTLLHEPLPFSGALRDQENVMNRFNGQ